MVYAVDLKFISERIAGSSPATGTMNKTDKTKCKLCGKTATGYAFVNDDRYCHGDYDKTPTCYEQANWSIK